jgi:putative autotransporter adhesin-like protein
MTVAPTPLHRNDAHRSRVVLGIVLAFALAAIAVILLAHYDVFGGSSGSSGVRGSGVAAMQTRELGPFDKIELAGSNNVFIRVGGKQSVVVRADENLLRRVTTTVEAGSLVIGNTSGTFTTKGPMSVEVVVPSLQALTLAGSGVVAATGIDKGHLTVTLSGSGVLRASGRATRLDIALSGSGDAQLEQLAARDVQAVVSGSGRILVTATRSLDASVPGSGAIVYTGNPMHVVTSITGSGAVTRG